MPPSYATRASLAVGKRSLAMSPKGQWARALHCEAFPYQGLRGTWLPLDAPTRWTEIYLTEYKAGRAREALSLFTHSRPLLYGWHPLHPELDPSPYASRDSQEGLSGGGTLLLESSYAGPARKELHTLCASGRSVPYLLCQPAVD